MKNTIQKKTELVNSVFSKVYNKYDVMNDIMSMGIHRVWKNKFLNWMNPQSHNNLIDVASGTGDIARFFSKITSNLGEVYCVEPNEEMFKIGKLNSIKYKNLRWYKSKAEKLPFKSNLFDYYSIVFVIRNKL